MYAREVEGRELTFGVSGKLIMNALVMYDRETDTLWSQFLGEAVQGELAGAKLRLMASQLVPKSAWIALHPDSLFLNTSGFSYDPYVSYYFSEAAGILGKSNPDDRLFVKELVMGIVGQEGQKAYAYRHLARSQVLNDTFEGRGLVATLVVDTAAGNLFDRTVDGKLLTFDQSDDRTQMSDRETGSIWDKRTGEALSGTLTGHRLEQALFISSFWFAWSDFWPDTDVYEPESG